MVLFDPNKGDKNMAKKKETTTKPTQSKPATPKAILTKTGKPFTNRDSGWKKVKK